MTTQIIVNRPGWNQSTEEKTWIRKKLESYFGVWERWEHQDGGVVNIKNYHRSARIVAARDDNYSGRESKTFAPVNEDNLQSALDWAEGRTYNRNSQ